MNAQQNSVPPSGGPAVRRVMALILPRLQWFMIGMTASLTLACVAVGDYDALPTCGLMLLCVLSTYILGFSREGPAHAPDGAGASNTSRMEAQQTPPVECQKCAELRNEAERLREQLAELSADDDASALCGENQRLRSQVEQLAGFLREIVGPAPCSGRGVEQDDDGRRFTEAEQSAVDLAHRRFCRRCRAAELLAQHGEPAGRKGGAKQ